MTSMDLIALDEVVGNLRDGPEFTTALSIPETASQVSAVIATYADLPPASEQPAPSWRVLARPAAPQRADASWPRRAPTMSRLRRAPR